MSNLGIIDKLKAEIAIIQQKIVAIQEQCSHPVEALEKKHGSIEGYSEPTQYYTDFHCQLCDKRWHEDGTK